MRLVRDSLATLALGALLIPGIAAADPLPPPSLPYVHSIRVHPPQPVDGDEVSIVLQGEFPYLCGKVELLENTFTLHMSHVRGCDSTGHSWSKAIPLGALRAGHHVANIRLIVDDDPAQGGGQGQYSTSVAFDVGFPGPRPGPLPYVSEIHIGPKRPLNSQGDTVAICPDDSIVVSFRGVFPIHASSCAGSFCFRR